MQHQFLCNCDCVLYSEWHIPPSVGEVTTCHRYVHRRLFLHACLSSSTPMMSTEITILGVPSLNHIPVVITKGNSWLAVYHCIIVPTQYWYVCTMLYMYIPVLWGRPPHLCDCLTVFFLLPKWQSATWNNTRPPCGWVSHFYSNDYIVQVHFELMPPESSVSGHCCYSLWKLYCILFEAVYEGCIQPLLRRC